MSTARKIARNTGLLMVASIFTNLMAFIWTIYSARYLGTAGFGMLSAALAITGLFSILMDLGLSTYATREIARDKSKTRKYLDNISLIKCILTTSTLILIYAYLFISDYPPLALQVTMLMGIYYVLTSFTALFNCVYIAHERMEFQAIGNIINSTVLLGGILLVISLKGDIISFGMAYVFTGMVTLTYSLLMIFWKFSRFSFEFDRSFWKESLTIALPFGITGIFTTIYFWIDTVMLQTIQGDVSVGLYNASYKLIFVLLSIYNVYMASLFPVMAKFFTHSAQSLKLTYHRSVKFMLILSLPIAVGTTIMAQDIILLIYGTEYLPSVMALQILIWCIVFMFVNGLSSNLLGSADNQLTVTKVTAIGAGANIAINLVVIPIFSFIGASVATVLTEFILLVLFTRAISKTDYALGRDILTNLWRIILPNVVMLGVLVFIDAPLIIMVIICTLVYFAGILLTRALDEQDIAIIKSIFKKVD